MRITNFFVTILNKYTILTFLFATVLVIYVTNGLLLTYESYLIIPFIAGLVNFLLVASFISIGFILYKKIDIHFYSPKIHLISNKSLQEKRTIFKHFWIYFWLFTLCFFVFRIPFYLEHLSGEDGTFANIFLNLPKGPNYFLIGRFNFKEIYIPIFHPALEFEILSLFGNTLKQLLPFKNLDDLDLAVRLRFSFSLFQYLIWIFVIWLIYKINKKRSVKPLKLIFLIIIFLANCPTAIENSVFLHIDGTYGILTAGIITILLVASGLNHLSKIQFYALLFFASILLGFGKTLWNIIFLISIFSMLPILLIWNKEGNREVNKFFPSLIIALIGLFIGNALNFTFDKINYLGSLDLTLDMARNTSFLSFLKDYLPMDIYNHQAIPFGARPISVFNSENWLRIQKDRALTLFVLYLIATIVIVYFTKNFFRTNLYLIWAGIWGLGLFLCYFSGTWSSDGRYFSPAFISLSIVLVAIIIDFNRPIKPLIYSPIIIIVLIYSIRHYSLNINLKKKYSVEYLSSQNEDRLILLNSKNKCMPLIGTFFFYEKDKDFLTFMTTETITDSIMVKNNWNNCKNINSYPK